MNYAPNTAARILTGAPPLARPMYAEVAVTAHEFLHWLACANPGDRIEYFRGEYAQDRTVHNRWRQIEHLFAAEKLMAQARACEKNRRCFLFQHRYGEFDYGYIAVRRATH